MLACDETMVLRITPAEGGIGDKRPYDTHPRSVSSQLRGAMIAELRPDGALSALSAEKF
jgi:hypothetical protein